MPHQMDLGDADEHLRSLIHDVVAEEDTVSFTEQGAPLATVVAAARLEAMQRTLELLRDSDLVDKIVNGLGASSKPGAQVLMDVLQRKGFERSIEIIPGSGA